eukprot:TRINITY_DN48595_c0_g1_i2.p2 TRINITY_DN48595_c0_g1~~TRINITY_DN48595_c0_g1_i2.p2  ORF type:complete len:185 (+),score=49.49 TRINITY_DN48595_c0_g1_i2:57-611(+)
MMLPCIDRGVVDRLGGPRLRKELLDAAPTPDDCGVRLHPGGATVLQTPPADSALAQRFLRLVHCVAPPWCGADGDIEAWSRLMKATYSSAMVAAMDAAEELAESSHGRAGVVLPLLGAGTRGAPAEDAAAVALASVTSVWQQRDSSSSTSSCICLVVQDESVAQVLQTAAESEEYLHSHWRRQT